MSKQVRGLSQLRLFCPVFHYFDPKKPADQHADLSLKGQIRIQKTQNGRPSVYTALGVCIHSLFVLSGLDFRLRTDTGDSRF